MCGLEKGGGDSSSAHPSVSTRLADSAGAGKGDDVQLAVDFVAGALDGTYDAGVIFSTDTDLRPALEFVADRFRGTRRAESAAWRGVGANRALRAQNPTPSWCHYLDDADYRAVADPTDYNIV